MNTEDYYHIWIETDEAKKYRNSDKYRHSEMMAFAKSWGKQQNKELMEALKETSSNLNAFYSQMGIENAPIVRIITRNDKLLKQK